MGSWRTCAGRMRHRRSKALVRHAHLIHNYHFGDLTRIPTTQWWTGPRRVRTHLATRKRTFPGGRFFTFDIMARISVESTSNFLTFSGSTNVVFEFPLKMLHVSQLAFQEMFPPPSRSVSYYFPGGNRLYWDGGDLGNCKLRQTLPSPGRRRYFRWSRPWKTWTRRTISSGWGSTGQTQLGAGLMTSP